MDVGTKHQEKKFCSNECAYTNTRSGREERFWARIDKNGPNGCWVYSGATDRRGYGRPAVMADGKRKRFYAHRRSYELHHGPIQPGKLVLHKCDNPPCCNPDHLFLGTDADNMMDKVLKGRTTRTLTRDQAREARLTFQAGGVTKAHLARKYGLCNSTMGKLLKGRIYKDAI